VGEDADESSATRGAYPIRQDSDVFWDERRSGPREGVVDDGGIKVVVCVPNGGIGGVSKLGGDRSKQGRRRGEGTAIELSVDAEHVAEDGGIGSIRLGGMEKHLGHLLVNTELRLDGKSLTGK